MCNVKKQWKQINLDTLLVDGIEVMRDEKRAEKKVMMNQD